MATGYSKSVEGGSDILFDFSCSSCAKDGHNKEAFHGCVDCAQNFCDKCLEFHNKLGITKGHKIVDKAGMISSDIREPTYLPTDICNTHPGKVMDMYCSAHDDVCCGACIAIDHRLCQGVDYLPSVAKGIKTSTKAKDVQDGLKNVQVELTQIMKTRDKDLKRIRKDKDKCLADIDTGWEKIIQHLDKMVKKAKDEVDTMHNTLENKINTEVQTLRETIATLDNSLKHLENFDGYNEVNLFLNVLKGNENNREGTKLLEQLQKVPRNETMHFSFNSGITDYLVNLKSIGEVKLRILANKVLTTLKIRNMKPISSATLQGNFIDKSLKNIIGSCLLDDGSLMVTDSYNKNLMRLDTNYKVVDKLALSNVPWGVCRTSPTEVAIALMDDRKIQFVSTSGTLSISRSFQVKEQPKYIAVSNGEMFVTSEEPVQVGVYNMTGDHLRTISTDSIGQRIFTNPRQIVLSNDGAKVHVIDAKKGVVTMTRQGQVQYTFSDPQLKSLWGACVLENDYLLVCGSSSNNMIQVDNQGRKVNVLLTKTDRILNPQSLTYDAINSRLIVTMKSTNQFKVFSLFR